MSTSYENIPARRIANLAATGQALFHTGDLAMLLGIRNPNTLRVTLSRLAHAGILHRVQRGLYSMLPPENIAPELIGAACLHRFAYLTTESVLRDEGYMLQSLDVLTFASSISRRFEVLGQRYLSRRLHARYLHHPLGIRRENGVFRATAERAIADLLYVHSSYHFDRPIDWKRIRAVQEAIGYPITPHRYADSTSP